MAEETRTIRRSLGFQDVSEEYILAVAIDLGTTFSGYAFSAKQNPDDIYVHSKWGEVAAIPHSFKTPTCLLTDTDLKFVALGYDAMSQYNSMKSDEAENYRYFEGFKMMLHSEKGISDKSTIQDNKGKSCLAIDVFSMVLRELKRHFSGGMETRFGSVPEEKYIRWVVTVPAIWSDAAKQFMREASIKAGLVGLEDNARLFIALEPEAASLYCRRLPVQDFSSSENGNVRNLDIGDQYIVLDAGGGTLDITAHEVLEDGRLSELIHANGGSMGGSLVNKNFLAFLDELLEFKIVDLIKVKEPGVVTSLINSFETIKRGVNPSKAKNTAIPLNIALYDLYRDTYDKSLQDSIKSDVKQKGVRIANGMLKLPLDIIQDIFKPVVDKIVEYVKELLENPALSQVSKILMVGGFSDCAILQKALQDNFGDRYTFLVPKDAWGAVLKGAVLFGHSPDIIRCRKSKMAYGIAVQEVYNPEVHDEWRAFEEDGIERVFQVFDFWIKREDEIKNDFVITKDYFPSLHDQQEVDITIFATENNDAMYTDEDDVHVVGLLNVQLPGTGTERSVEVFVKFGGTEIQVEARDKRDGGDHVSTNIDFFVE